MLFLMDNFGEWLVAELDRRDISQSDLSRLSGLSQGTISNIISGVRGRGPESIVAIAKALKLPIEKVYREAGLLPPRPNHNEEIEQLVHEAEGMTKEEQLELLSYIRWKNNLRKKKK